MRNNRLGPSGLVQDREYQAIAAGKRDKRDVLCENTNVRSHMCDWQLNHHKKSNNYFFLFRNNFFCCWNNCYCLSDKKIRKKVCSSNKALRGLIYYADFRSKTWNPGEVVVL